MLCLLLLSTGCSFGRLPCFRPTGELRTQHTTRSSVFLLEVCFDDTTGVEIGGCWLAGWLAPIVSGGTCPIFPVAVEFFSCASISTLVYIRES
jgi:hypothetical protein